MVRSCLLHLSLQAEHSLLHLSLFNELTSFSDKINRVFGLLLEVWVLLFECDDGGVPSHLELMVLIPRVTPGFHHFVHFFHLASLFHPVTHHFLHVVVRQLLLPFKDVAEFFAVGTLDILLLIVFLLLFFLKVASDFFLLPLVPHLCVHSTELGLFLSVLDDLVTLHSVSPMVQLEKKLEEFAVSMLRVL